jgi:hypothetical protein
MAQYQNYALGPKFDPPTPIDNTTKARKRYEQELSALQDFFNSNRVVDQQRIEDARFAGQNYEKLAPFVKEFGTTTQAFVKKANEDKVIGQYVDSAMREDPRISEVEDQAYEFGKRAEGTSKLFSGVANEQAFLNDVAASLDSDVNTLLQSNYMVNYNGQQLPLFQLAQNPATASMAVDFALRQVYKKRGVNYATKAGFVEILKPMHRQVLQNRTSNLVTQANAVQQRSNQAKLQQEASASAARLTKLAEAGQLAPGAIDAEFIRLADNARKLNTGLSASEAQVVILDQMLGTPERDKSLNTELQNVILPGGGQRLGDLYWKTFNKDADRLKKNQDRYDQEQATDLAADNRLQVERFLNSGGSFQDARKLSKRLYEQIRLIDPEVAQNFDTNINSLIGRRGSEYYNDTAIAIANGDMTVTETTIKTSGLPIEQQTSLIDRLDTRKDVEELVGDDVRSKIKTIVTAAKKGAGFRLDKEGRYTTPSGWFNGGDVAPIENAKNNMRNDLFRELQNYAASAEYKELPSAAARKMALEKKADQLLQDYTGPGGWYQGLGFLRDAENKTLPKDAQDKVVNMLRQHANVDNLSYFASKENVVAKEAYWDPGKPVATSLKNAYVKSGGVNESKMRILTYSELEEYGKTFNETGSWPTAFTELAAGLGYHPMQLWEQQNRSIKLPLDVDSRIQLNKKIDTTKPVGITPGPKITEAEAKTLSLGTAQWLQNTGMSENAGFVAWTYFVYTPKAQWEALVKEMKADSALWPIISSPYRTKRQNTTALYNWFENRNRQ